MEEERKKLISARKQKKIQQELNKRKIELGIMPKGNN